MQAQAREKTQPCHIYRFETQLRTCCSCEHLSEFLAIGHEDERVRLRLERADAARNPETRQTYVSFPSGWQSTDLSIGPDAVHEMVRYCFSSMRSKALNKVAKANDSRVTVQKADVLW